MKKGTCEPRGPSPSAAITTPKPRRDAKRRASAASMRNWGLRMCIPTLLCRSGGYLDPFTREHVTCAATLPRGLFSELPDEPPRNHDHASGPEQRLGDKAEPDVAQTRRLFANGYALLRPAGHRRRPGPDPHGWPRSWMR